jgi:hypothetical protein
MMSNDITRFNTADISERLVGITPQYLNNFLQRRLFGLRASVQSGKVRSRRRLFSQGDVFGIALVWQLFESGLRTDPIARVLKDISQSKTANANEAARKLLNSGAEFLLIRRRARKPSKIAAEKPDQVVEATVRLAQLPELIGHSDETFLVIPIGKRFAEITTRINLLS